MTQEPNRRDFMLASGTAVLAAALPSAGLGLHRSNRETLRVGLIGCGGRGTGAAANALRADPDVQLVALGDAFLDQLQNCLNTLRSTEDIQAKVAKDVAQFVGFDAYQGVIEASDVVLMATSPHFRPLHMRAAVAAGKHIFCEKPVAVDGPGLRSVLDSCRQAQEKRLNVVSGLCYRYQFAKQATFQKIEEGAIGDIVALQCTYNTGPLWHRGHEESWSDMEYQMRNWLYFYWLSGDHAAEQHIHSLDKVAWAMKDVPPARCTSSGGRIQRIEEKYGNVYDHFNSVFEWESGVRAFSSCRQWHGSSTNVSDQAFGTRGTAELQGHKITGENPWRWRSEEPDDMYQNEHDALFQAIRSGNPINNGKYMCQSTLMALMIRMSAYTGQTITWEQALNSQEDLTPPSYTWGPLAMAPIPRPGLTKFA